MDRLTMYAGGIVVMGLFAIANGCDLVSIELVEQPSSNNGVEVATTVDPNANSGTQQWQQQNPNPVQNTNPFQPAAMAKVHGQRVKETWVGRVVGVSDGDTVTILNGQNEDIKVRLGGIDAPEKKQPYGEASKQELSNWVFNKIVTVRVVDKDRYGRQIAFLDVDGSDVNASMVWVGLAWEYVSYSKSSVMSGYQLEAQSQRRGLWAGPTPTPPWEWRKKK